MTTKLIVGKILHYFLTILLVKQIRTRQESSMIHSGQPTVSADSDFRLILKFLTDGRTTSVDIVIIIIDYLITMVTVVGLVDQRYYYAYATNYTTRGTFLNSRFKMASFQSHGSQSSKGGKKKNQASHWTV